MGNTGTIDALRAKLWQTDLFVNAIDGMYFTENGMMGEDDNNIVQIKSDLKNKKGDTLTYGLTSKVSGDGVEGDEELEGNEGELTAYSDSISINQWRDAVRLEGNFDEQTAAYNMRKDAKEKLAIKIQEFVERQVFLKLGGVTNATLTDVDGNIIAGKAAWSNTPAIISNAVTNTGKGSRYLCANYTAGATALGPTNLLTPALISRVKAMAMTGNPKIRPLRINGKNYFILFVHPWQAFDLKNDSVWSQAQREAQMRGDDNPIFTGALGIWDSVIIHEHEYVPFLDISAAGRNFGSATTGTVYGNDCFRALFCGRQAAAFAQCQNSKGWVEKTFDYENEVGFKTGIIGGIQKVTFNSKEYGVIAVDTAATALN